MKGRVWPSGLCASGVNYKTRPLQTLHAPCSTLHLESWRDFQPLTTTSSQQSSPIKLRTIEHFIRSQAATIKVMKGNGWISKDLVDRPGVTL